MSSAAKAENRRLPLSVSSSRVLLVGAVVLGAIAYRALLGWNPGVVGREEAPDLFVPGNTSPLFIGCLSVFLTWLRLPLLRRTARSADPAGWGWLLLLPGSLLFLWARYTSAFDLMLLSLIAVVLGAAAVLVGSAFARALALPVGFLLFAFPLPAVLVNQEVYSFQMGTAALTAKVLDWIGTGAILQGDLIFARGRLFQVIETCSGLRLTETLLFSAVVYGQVMGSRRRHAVLLFLLAPLLGFVLNTARVLMIIYNPLQDHFEDHTVQGLAVVVVGVLAFAGIERLLLRFWPSGPRVATLPRTPVRSADESEDAARPAAWAVVALLAILACASFWLPRWDLGGAPPRWQIEFPTRWKGWQARLLEPDEDFLGSVYFSRKVSRRYEKDGMSVDTFFGKDDRLRRDRSILSPKTQVPGTGWVIQARRRAEVDWASTPVQEIVATRQRQRALIYTWREGFRGFWQEVAHALLALDQSPMRPSDELRVFRVSTPLETSDERGLAEARQRLDQFAPAVRESINTL